MLSRLEVWEAQEIQRKYCNKCCHKPKDGYCREQLVMGEQRMDSCEHFKFGLQGTNHDPWVIEKPKVNRILRMD